MIQNLRIAFLNQGFSTGVPLTVKSQGGVESVNQDIEKMITTWI